MAKFSNMGISSLQSLFSSVVFVTAGENPTLTPFSPSFFLSHQTIWCLCLCFSVRPLFSLSLALSQLTVCLVSVSGSFPLLVVCVSSVCPSFTPGRPSFVCHLSLSRLSVIYLSTYHNLDFLCLLCLCFVRLTLSLDNRYFVCLSSFSGLYIFFVCLPWLFCVCVCISHLSSAALLRVYDLQYITYIFVSFLMSMTP
jgi:hypothetical protein